MREFPNSCPPNVNVTKHNCILLISCLWWHPSLLCFSIREYRGTAPPGHNLWGINSPDWRAWEVSAVSPWTVTLWLGTWVLLVLHVSSPKTSGLKVRRWKYNDDIKEMFISLCIPQGNSLYFWGVLSSCGPAEMRPLQSRSLSSAGGLEDQFYSLRTGYP